MAARLKESPQSFVSEATDHLSQLLSSIGLHCNLCHNDSQGLPDREPRSACPVGLLPFCSRNTPK